MAGRADGGRRKGVETARIKSRLATQYALLAGWLSLINNAARGSFDRSSAYTLRTYTWASGVKQKKT